jgi:hypothetical protein
MGLFRSQASQKPTALGTQLQNNVYGAIIPSIFGCARGVPLPIWAANLRPGTSGKKGKKKGKKGKPPAYVENIDMLIGSNPISGVLQIWSNVSNEYPLNFQKVKVNTGNANLPVGPGGVADPNFYFVVAVTADVTLSATFDDYGAPGPNVVAPAVYEYPLWNVWEHGPDLVNAGTMRWYPWIYSWRPAMGALVQLPFFENFMAPSHGLPNATGDVNIYYAQKSAVIKHQTPLQFNRFEFETSLGNGDEYSDAGLGSQQVIQPEFAGVESSDMDLGSSGAIPAWRFEIVGSYNFLPPRGDAEFADILEDIIKTGQLQVGEALGLIQRGVNCNDLPGFIQKVMYQQLEPTDPAILTYYQPNQVGTILIDFTRWRNTGIGSPTILDDAGNSWNPVFIGSNSGLWWAQSIGALAGNRVSASTSASEFDVRSYIFESDPGSTIAKSAAVQGTTSVGNQKISVSIYVDGPALLFVAAEDSQIEENISPHWESLIPVLTDSGGAVAQPLVMQRRVTKAGAYTFSFTLPTPGATFNLGMIAITGKPSPLPKTLGKIIDEESFFQTRLQCRAGGLQGSLIMDSQRTAADWCADLFKCADAAPVWDGFHLYSIPRSEVSAIGQGAIFNAPTAPGPVADLTSSDFVGDSSKPMIVVERTAQVDAENIYQVQCFNRNDKYNQAMIEEPQTGAIALYGPRPASPMNLPMLMDPAVARIIAAIEGRRNTILRNVYKFTLQPKWLILRAMSLVTITDELIGLIGQPVRLTSVVENEKGELECEAEPFVYGVHAPNLDLIAPTTAPYAPNLSAIPADVNTPIFLEPTPRLVSSSPQSTASSPQQLWIVLSDPDPNYGGAVVLLSTDGGASYNAIGQTVGNAITGHTTADWPIANDPDTSNNLPLDLTESLGVLASYAAADRDAFTYPCYIEHGTAAIPYGLMTYNAAILTGTNLYTLAATGTGNELRRCVFGAPQPLTDVDHPNGSRWAFLNPAGTGIFKMNLDPKWIGKTLFFKFLAYNQFQSAVEDQASATVYSYTPLGVAQASDPSNFVYTISGGALTNPTPTTIHMAQATGATPNGNVNYNARTFTIAAPSVPTTYYVTILDPQHLGDTGALTNLSASADLTTTHVGQPGYVYIGSITVLPGGGGTTTTPGGSNPGDTLEVNGVAIQ